MAKKSAKAKSSPEGFPALSIDQQWSLVESTKLKLQEAARNLEKSKCWESAIEAKGEETQSLANLEHTWLTITAQTSLPPLLASRVYITEDARVGATPIEAIVSYLDKGYYPPPELLLAVRHAFYSYRDAEGERTLEECFFGKPKQRAGNYSARSAQALQEFGWAFEILARSKAAGSDEKVAGEIVNRENLDIDEQTVLRRARKHWQKGRPDPAD